MMDLGALPSLGRHGAETLLRWTQQQKKLTAVHARVHVNLGQDTGKAQ